ncbi:hypothetical protein [Methylobacterium sp. NFXW15]|uniref:hypothetical protein n=1 Tax=Methylobacterium sp. NFXW15 TaxID=2819512 RepID=UPI003CF75DC2
MRRAHLPALAMALCVVGHAPAARSAPANTLKDLWAYLGRCVTIEGASPGAAGSEVTVLFSVKRDGSLNGKPRIAHSRLLGSEEDQRSFIGAALGAVSRCLPADITDGLGGAIAGRPLRVRLTSGKPERSL